MTSTMVGLQPLSNKLIRLDAVNQGKCRAQRSCVVGTNGRQDHCVLNSVG